MPKSRQPKRFVDASGGAFAALAAAIARAHGLAGATAATTSDAVAIPAEIATVLDEIGLTLPEVTRAGEADKAAPSVDVSTWPLSLHPGEGQLERLAAARIARDRIERRIEALGKSG